MYADNVVILAGGSSERFGSNKLLHKVNGKEMIRRVVEAASQVGRRVVLSVRNEGQGEILSKLTGINYIVDLNCSGPMGAVISAVPRYGRTLILPGDLPWVDAEVLNEFMELAYKISDSEIHGIIWPSSKVLDSVIVLLNSYEPVLYLKKACSLKKTRMTDLHRASRSLTLMSPGLLKEGWRLTDTDRLEELKQGLTPQQGKWFTIRQEALGCPYRSAIDYLSKGDLRRAVENFELELAMYKDIENLRAHIARDIYNLRGS